MDLTMMRAAETVWALAGGWLRPQAYLDPGSGSYLLQLLIAGALGALFALRVYWKRVKGFFLKIIGRDQEEEGGG